MEYYKEEIKEVLRNLEDEGYETREEIIKRWEEGDTQDDFGNMTGSRFCSVWKAEEALKQAGFPFDEDLNAMLQEVGYDFSILNKGAEVVDVILCELTVPYIIDELKEEA